MIAWIVRMFSNGRLYVIWTNECWRAKQIRFLSQLILDLVLVTAACDPCIPPILPLLLLYHTRYLHICTLLLPCNMRDNYYFQMCGLWTYTIIIFLWTIFNWNCYITNWSSPIFNWNYYITQWSSLKNFIVILRYLNP